MDKITSQPFKITGDRYLKLIMSRWIGRWWWAISIPVAIQLIMATVNTAFIYTSFITIFLIIPPIMMLLCYNHALSSEARYATLLKRIEFNAHGITLIFTTSVNSDNSDTPQPVIPHPIEYHWEQIASCQYSRKEILLTLNSSRYHIIPIPYSTIDEPHKPALASILDKHFPAPTQ